MTKRTGRLYWRGGKEETIAGRVVTRARRAYGDFRDFADVGGSQEPLIPRGERFATSDPDTAVALIFERLADLKRMREEKAARAVPSAGPATLGAYVAVYLDQRRREGSLRRQSLEELRGRLEAAVLFFGQDRPLAGIRVRDVKAWAFALLERPARDGDVRPLAPGSVRHYLNALSGVYAYAGDDELVDAGYNPLTAWQKNKPKGERREGGWLEADEAALLLEAARTLPTPPPFQPKGFMVAETAHALLATLLLTGARESEVLGLTVEDVSLEHGIVRFRPNRWRLLKTATSNREVPLWPQLRAILEPLAGVRLDAPPRSGLLFPSGVTGGMLTDWRKTLDKIATRAGLTAGSVRTKHFRHTYATLRHHTLDQGRPVGWKTVADELGHSSWRMLEERYAKHRPRVRLVGDVLAFQVADYAPAYRVWSVDRKAAVASDLRRAVAGLSEGVCDHTPTVSVTTPTPAHPGERPGRLTGCGLRGNRGAGI